MMPFEGGMILLIALVTWAIPIALAVWLVLSINEIRSLLRDIRNELRDPAR